MLIAAGAALRRETLMRPNDPAALPEYLVLDAGHFKALVGLGDREGSMGQQLDEGILSGRWGRGSTSPPEPTEATSVDHLDKKAFR